MVRAADSCIHYPSTDAPMGRRLSPGLREQASKDDDSLQTLSNVQRQLVQKSFQTHAFEAKIRTKDRDDEHATTANEVLHQALRSHAASVASLHVDSVPSADDYRQRMPKRSLGRFQYEDLSRMPPAMAEAPNADCSPVTNSAEAPSPQQPLQSQLKPAGRLHQSAQDAGGSSRSLSLSSTGTGDGNGGSTGGGTGDASTPQATTSSRAEPATGSWRRRTEAAPGVAKSTGMGSGAVARVAFTRLPHMGLGVGSGSGTHSGGSSAGQQAATAGATNVAEAAGCGVSLLRRTDSGMRRADQMLQALRDFHGSAVNIAGGGGGSSALPHIPRPPGRTVPSCAKPGAQPGSLRSNTTSPTAKHRHVATGGGATATSGAGSCSGYVPRAAASTAQDHPVSKSLSITGSSLTPACRQYPQLRSYQAPPCSRSVDSIPRAVGTTVSLPPPPPASTEEAPGAGQDGGELASWDGATGLSFTTSVWRPPPPPLLTHELSGGSAAAGPSCLRPSFPSGDGAAPPTQHGRSIRFSSSTNEGEELALSGGGAADALVASSGPSKTVGSGGAGSLLPTPLAPASEQLFRRISRSTARASPQQQEWVPTFDPPLPAASVFTAASCGASPYAAAGLGACAAAERGGGGSFSGRHPNPRTPMQRLPSGALPQPQLPQARSVSPSAAPTGVKLPPIHDSSITAPGTTAAERRGRVRTSLSWSVADGAATAAFVQRVRATASPPDTANPPDTVTSPNSDPMEYAAASAGAAPPPWRAQARAVGQQPQQQRLDGAFQRGSRDRAASTDGAPWRQQAAPAAAVVAQVELIGPAAAAAYKGWVGEGDAVTGGGGGFAPRRSKQQHPAAVQGSGDVGAGGLGGGFGIISHGGRGSGVGVPGDLRGSPSIMKRMKKALGTFWPKSPGQ